MTIGNWENKKRKPSKIQENIRNGPIKIYQSYSKRLRVVIPDFRVPLLITHRLKMIWIFQSRQLWNMSFSPLDRRKFEVKLYSYIGTSSAVHLL